MARPKNHAARRQRQAHILDAARIIFAQDGLAEARMDDIAQQCGVSKGTLYLYYKNKDDLIVGLLEALFDVLLDKLQALGALDSLTLEARLLHYGAEVVEHMEADASMMTIAYEFYAIAARRPQVRALLQDYFTNYRRVIAELLQQAIIRREIPPVDVTQSAIVFIALLEGLTLLWFTDSQQVQLRDALPHAIKQFVHSLKQEDTP